ncbi:hypothetical protein [Gordonia sputi]|uniref:hypothetical protein n=1 Tax=Gordonia sputi TaxID=36823 RepID=UPI0036B73EAC
MRAIDPVERRMLLKAGAGVIEAIAAWVDPDYRFVDDVTVADIIAANSLIALGHCGAAVMVCDSADHSTGRWVRAGARPLTPYSSRAYPAPGYSTVPLVFELDELGLRMDRQLLMLAVEQISTQTGWETAAAMLRMALPQLPRTNSRMEVDEGE